MKVILMGFVILLASGCSNLTGDPSNLSPSVDPKNFKCHSDYIAYCQGRNRATMECTCVSRKYERQILQSIGIN